MGDFIAKIEYSKEGDIVEDHGLGVRNESGDWFVQDCLDKETAIMRTNFKLPKRCLFTWKAPSDSPSRIVRSQIYFITITKRYTNSVISVTTYPGADVPSELVLLLVKISYRLKKTQVSSTVKKSDLSKLKNHKDKTRSPF